mmetsp:Transcript_42475/g.99487  ORF Transcript_42475/g.99487 Transcript_42475/m.99487 type:complete len:238 (-) Transcript_42475:1417-2130(-)
MCSDLQTADDGPISSLPLSTSHFSDLHITDTAPAASPSTCAVASISLAPSPASAAPRRLQACSDSSPMAPFVDSVRASTAESAAAANDRSLWSAAPSDALAAALDAERRSASDARNGGAAVCSGAVACHNARHLPSPVLLRWAEDTGAAKLNSLVSMGSAVNERAGEAAAAAERATGGVSGNALTTCALAEDEAARTDCDGASARAWGGSCASRCAASISSAMAPATAASTTSPRFA